MPGGWNLPAPCLVTDAVISFGPAEFSDTRSDGHAQVLKIFVSPTAWRWRAGSYVECSVLDVNYGVRCCASGRINGHCTISF